MARSRLRSSVAFAADKRRRVAWHDASADALTSLPAPRCRMPGL
jgi:hypothetical protein